MNPTTSTVTELHEFTLSPPEEGMLSGTRVNLTPSNGRIRISDQEHSLAEGTSAEVIQFLQALIEVAQFGQQRIEAGA